jgi:hypothetical protein
LNTIKRRKVKKDNTKKGKTIRRHKKGKKGRTINKHKTIKRGNNIKNPITLGRINRIRMAFLRRERVSLSNPRMRDRKKNTRTSRYIP